MASTKKYLDFILGQLSDLDEVSFRTMMGEYGEKGKELYLHECFHGCSDGRLQLGGTAGAAARAR